MACRFFLRGQCREGQSCPFRHDTDIVGVLPKHRESSVQGSTASNAPTRAPDTTHGSLTTRMTVVNTTSQQLPVSETAQGRPCRGGVSCPKKLCRFTHPPDRRFQDSADVDNLQAAPGHETLSELFRVGDEFSETRRLTAAARKASTKHRSDGPPPDFKTSSGAIELFTGATVFSTIAKSKTSMAFQFPPGCGEVLLIHLADPHRALAGYTDADRTVVFDAAASILSNTYAYNGVRYCVLPPTVHHSCSFKHGDDSFVPAITLRQPLAAASLCPVGSGRFLRSAVQLETAATFAEADRGDSELVLGLRRKLERLASALIAAPFPAFPQLSESQLLLFKSPQNPCPPLESDACYVEARPRHRHSLSERCVLQLNRFFERQATDFLLMRGPFAEGRVDDPRRVLLAEPWDDDAEDVDTCWAASGGLFHRRHIAAARTSGLGNRVRAIASDMPGMWPEAVVLTSCCRFLPMLREYPALFNVARLGACIDSDAQPWDACPQLGLQPQECEQLTRTLIGRERSTLYTARPLVQLMERSISMQRVLDGNDGGHDDDGMHSGENSGQGGPRSRREQVPYRFPVIVTRATEFLDDRTVLVVFPPCGRARVARGSEGLLQQARWVPVQGYLCTASKSVHLHAHPS